MSNFWIDELRVYAQVFDQREQCEVVIGGTWDGAGQQCTLPAPGTP